VVEPPHVGLSAEAISLIARAGVQRLAYVSDDPGTLARDTRVLARHGYRLRRVRVIDLMPQTSFVDSVAVFERD
jgi:23S rRNA (uracil1939-C5)-methyltransferase